MDKLLARCAKHRQDAEKRKHRKSTRTPRRNTSKLQQPASATSAALQTPTQTTNTPKKAPQNATSKHAAMTKHAKAWKQAQTAQTAPKNRRMKPDGTPKDPDSNPVMKYSNPEFDGIHLIENAEPLTPDNKKQPSENPANKQAQSRTIGDPILTLPEAERLSRIAHGTEKPDTVDSIDAAHTLTQAPDAGKTEGKTGDGGKGLTPVAWLPHLKPNPNAKKLNRKAKVDVIKMLAMNYTSRAIVVWLIQNHRVKVSRQGIDKYRNKHRNRIGQARDILSKDIQEAVPTALKLNRIAIRDEMVQELRRKPWKGSSQQTINRLLDSIRAEMEPLEVNLSVDLRGKTAQQYKDVTDQGVIAEAMKNLKAAGMEIAQVEPPEPKK